jgi:hypothetical protein
MDRCPRIVFGLTILAACRPTPDVEQSVVGAAPAGSDAQIVSHTIPSSMVAGELITASVTVLNRGATPWSRPAWMLHWIPGSTFFSWADTLVSGPVAPGGMTTFDLVLVAPPSGPQTFSAMMLVDDLGVGGFFGQRLDVPVAITSGTRRLDAHLVSQTFPTVLTPGAEASVQVVMENTGTLSWTAGGAFLFYNRNDPSNLWGIVDAPVPMDTPPNARATFTLNIRAPSSSGPVDHRWQMYASNVGFFGDLVDVPATIGRVLEQVNVNNAGMASNGQSSPESVSADGRYVTWYSNGTNVLPGVSQGVFLRDRQAQQTTLVSVASDGSPANGSTNAESTLTPDARFVAFASAATNLAAAKTNSGVIDVFLHDRQTGLTSLVSQALDGKSGNGQSDQPRISDDGRFVVFESAASNLVPGDTNGAQDVFVRDTVLGTTLRVSVAENGAQANSVSPYPYAMTGDGRYVAFSSAATNLATSPAVPFNVLQAYLRDNSTGHITLISQADNGTPGDSSSHAWAISPDGRFVVFDSNSSNLFPGKAGTFADIYVRDVQANHTSLISSSSNGTPGNADSNYASISADGRFVAFISNATNLVPGDTNNVTDMFVKDRLTGQTTRVNLMPVGSQFQSTCTGGKISADGNWVIFGDEGIVSFIVSR